MPARPTLWLVLVLAGVLAVVGGSTLVPQVLLLPLGVASVLWMPGYALVVTVMGGLYPTRLLGAVMAIVTSLMIVVFIGVGLHLTPEGMTPRTWSVELGAITAVLAVAALVRTRRMPSAPLRDWRLPRLGIAPLRAITLAVTYVTAGLVVVGAIALAVNSAAIQRSSESVTSLWMLPGAAGTVRIGVSNRNGSPQHYRLDLTYAGAPVESWEIPLAADHPWETTIADPRARTRTPGDLEATLTATDPPSSETRRVVLRGTSRRVTTEPGKSGPP